MVSASEANARQADAWNRNAPFWDKRMDEQHDFFRVLVWPATEKLLGIKPGDEVLDIACGNGVSSRSLARLGAHVLATDFAEAMIEAAKKRPTPGPGTINYQLLDATDEPAIRTLGAARFRRRIVHHGTDGHRKPTPACSGTDSCAQAQCPLRLFDATPLLQ